MSCSAGLLPSAPKKERPDSPKMIQEKILLIWKAKWALWTRSFPFLTPNLTKILALSFWKNQEDEER